MKGEMAYTQEAEGKHNEMDITMERRLWTSQVSVPRARELEERRELEMKRGALGDQAPSETGKRTAEQPLGVLWADGWTGDKGIA